MDINSLSEDDFKELPLVVEGESKEVRYAGNGTVVIRLKPTVYSYTQNRAGTVVGSDTLRLQAIQAFIPVLKKAGLHHTYLEVNNRWILSQLVLQPVTIDCPKPFRPTDLNEQQLAQLPVAPPVEIVVKRIHSGTPKHRYYRFDQYKTRLNQSITNDKPYPETVVRFDWRNPMTNKKGERLADEVLPEIMANWYIDVKAASNIAIKAFRTLESHLELLDIELWDICFFVTEDGLQLFGEISPDCMRVRAKDGSSLDKDIWRSGGSSADVLQKWQRFVEILGSTA